MGEKFIEERKIVVPGTLLAQGSFKTGDGVYKKGDKIYASRLGLSSVKNNYVGVIPLEGKYTPKEGDTPIGVVSDVHRSHWEIDMEAPYKGLLRGGDVIEGNSREKDLEDVFDVGDVIYVKISKVNEVGKTILTTKGVPHSGKSLQGGLLTTISSVKVPRLIGKKGSMIDMIKKETNCKIIVGQNGWVWIKGNDHNYEKIARKAVEMVENKSHVSGLTEKIKDMIEEEKQSM